MNLNRKQPRKRDKIYLRKLYYLKNFLALLHVYRAHLARCRCNSVTTHSTRKSIERWRYRSVTRCRRQFRLTCTKFYQSLAARRHTEIVYYFYDFRLSMTSFITSPGFHFVEPSRRRSRYYSISSKLMGNSLIAHEAMDPNEISSSHNSSDPTPLRSAGQMLINWFVQSLQSASSALTASLNENDQNVLAYQFCSNLLAVGVIRKLDETTTTPESAFKV